MERMTAFCGIVCTECPAFIATQKNDQEALKRVAAQWSQQFNASIASEDCICDGCLAFEGRMSSYCHECKIRACGIEKKVQNCAHCDDYPSRNWRSSSPSRRRQRPPWRKSGRASEMEKPPAGFRPAGGFFRG